MIEDEISYIYPDDEKDKNIDYKNWQMSADGTTYYPDIKIIVKEKMDPGLYIVGFGNEGYFARKKDLTTDRLFKIYDNKVDEMVEEITKFWQKAEIFEKSGFIHKRGIMLVGGPGQGKSSIIHLMCKELEKNGGIAFLVDSPESLTTYKSFIQIYFRKIEPTTPILLVLEDIDLILEESSSELLSILDGQDSINHQLVIATSNHMEELSDLLLRPSRFDWIIEIKSPNKKTREMYFKGLGLVEDELTLFVDKSDTLSMAQLKELYIAVKLLDNDMELVLDRITDNKKKVYNTTFKPKTSIGFNKK